MQIACPHCDTRYDVRDDALSAAGRTVRCARCKKTWLALPAAERALAGGFADPPLQAPDSAPARPELSQPDPVRIDSPPLVADMPGTDELGRPDAVAAQAIDSIADSIEPTATPLRRRRPAAKIRLGMPVILAALFAACAAIVIWRADAVRLLPQTAPFFKTLGLGVNLRALDFSGIKISTETVNGTAIVVIEGEVVARKPVEVPRLRFGLNDASGKEIHAWNATIEQASLGAGEHASFVSRLAAPAPEAREITVRFFNRRDIASGGK